MKMFKGGKLISAGLLTLLLTLTVVACDYNGDPVNDVDPVDPNEEIGESDFIDQETYTERAREEFDQLSTEVDSLRSRIEAQGENVSAEMEEMLEDLEQREQEAQEAIQDLEAASSATWTDFRTEVSNTLRDFASAFSDLETEVDTGLNGIDADGDNL